MQCMYLVIKDGEVVYEGEAVDIREWVEVELSKTKIGFAPMLQEFDEDDEFRIYLHTEFAEELEEEEVEMVESLGFNDYDSTEIICNLLDITIQRK